MTNEYKPIRGLKRYKKHPRRKIDLSHRPLWKDILYAFIIFYFAIRVIRIIGLFLKLGGLY